MYINELKPKKLNIKSTLTLFLQFSECHRQGKVLFEGEGCYNLLERGPCFEQSMWLVMTIQVVYMSENRKISLLLSGSISLCSLSLSL